MRVAFLMTPESLRTKRRTVQFLMEMINRQEDHLAYPITSWKDLEEIPDVYLSRFYGLDEELTSIAAYLESLEVRAINPLRSTALMNDKHAAHLTFARAGIWQLPWQMISKGGVFGYPAWEGRTVVKPRQGFGSFGVEVFSTREEALAQAPAGSVLQPYVSRAKAWRLIVGRKGGVIASYYRQSDGEIHAVSRGARRIYADPGEEAKEMALRMNDALGGVFVGCDLLERDRQFLALEVNNSIGLDRQRSDLFPLVIQEILG